MPDVYLLTEGRDGVVAVPRLTLTFLDSGLALDKADGGSVWESDWGGLEEMSPVERSVLPDGREGVVIVVVEQGRRHSHRFVLGTDDAARPRPPSGSGLRPTGCAAGRRGAPCRDC